MWKVVRPFTVAAVVHQPHTIKLFVKLFRALEQKHSPGFIVDVRLSKGCCFSMVSLEAATELYLNLLAEAQAV